MVDQRISAYHLDRKSSITFYLLILFDLVVPKLVSTPSWFTIWWIKTTLPCLITKQSSHTIWLVGTQVAAEHQQNKKLDQRENISTDLPSYLSEFQYSRKHFEWYQKEVFDGKTVVKRTEYSAFLCLVKEENWCFLFLADWEIYLFIVVFSSYSTAEVLKNKIYMLNFIFIWLTVQKQLPGGVL